MEAIETDARAFIDAEHERLHVKARRVDAAPKQARMALLASFVADAELHAQLIEEMLAHVRTARGLRTVAGELAPHGDAERSLLDELAGMDAHSRRAHAGAMALRRRVLDRTFAGAE